MEMRRLRQTHGGKSPDKSVPGFELHEICGSLKSNGCVSVVANQSYSKLGSSSGCSGKKLGTARALGIFAPLSLSLFLRASIHRQPVGDSLNIGLHHIAPVGITDCVRHCVFGPCHSRVFCKDPFISLYLVCVNRFCS